jgi:hypothetical protein
MTLKTGYAVTPAISDGYNDALQPTRSAFLHLPTNICEIDYAKCLVRHLLRRFVRVAGFPPRGRSDASPDATYGSRRQAGR